MSNAKSTFTVTFPNGTTETFTSGAKAVPTHAVVVEATGNEWNRVAGEWYVLTKHATEVAARKRQTTFNNFNNTNRAKIAEIHREA